MKHPFKLIVLIVVNCFLLLAQNAFCQEGFTLINRAEACVKRGALQKAEKLLIEAGKADYGFCGNAHISAYCRIELVRFQMDMMRGNFSEAEKRLRDNEMCVYDYEGNFDSLWINLYCKKYGRELVAEEVEGSLSKCSFVLLNGEPQGFEIPLVSLPTLKWPFNWSMWVNWHQEEYDCKLNDTACYFDEYMAFLKRKGFFGLFPASK